MASTRSFARAAGLSAVGLGALVLALLLATALSIELSLAVSFAALVTSIIGWTEGKRRHKRNLFMDLQIKLLDPEIQKGRSELLVNVVVDYIRNGQQGPKPEEYLQVGRSLALMDVVAHHAELGLIDYDMFFKEWWHFLGSNATFIEAYVKSREDSKVREVWPRMMRAMRKAEARLARETAQQQE